MSPPPPAAPELSRPVPRSQTLGVSIRTSFERAWDFIANPENLHLWTVDFAIAPPTKAGELFRVETPRGPLDLFVKTHPEAGTIDFHFGRDGRFGCSPSRLVRLDGCVLYVFTQLEPENAPPGTFERLVSNVARELEILRTQLEAPSP